MTSPNALADEIERIAMHWRGANGCIYAIRGMSVEIARHLAARVSPAPDVTVEEIIAEANNAYNEFMEDVEDYQAWEGNTHAEAMNRVGGAVMALIERHRTADRWRLYCAQKHRPVLPPVRHVRHKKRGTTYQVLGEAEAQISVGLGGEYRDPLYRHLREGARLIVYRGDDGKLWLRFPDEFEDGRFEDIEPAPEHRPATTRDGGDGHPCASIISAPCGASAPDPSGQVDRASADIDADVGVLSGWKLVPVEPREAMIKAGDAQLDSGAYAERIYRSMLAVAPTPPSPKGVEDASITTAPSASFDVQTAKQPQDPDAECDSASGAQGLAELNAEATPEPWRHENTAFSSYLLAGGVGWVSEAPLEAEYWRGGADKSSAVKNHLFILALVNAYRSGSLVSGDALTAAQRQIAELARQLDQKFGTPCEQIRHAEEVATLENRVTELEAALKPFAKHAEYYDQTEVAISHRRDDDPFRCFQSAPYGRQGHRLSIGDLRRAHRALLPGGSDGR